MVRNVPAGYDWRVKHPLVLLALLGAACAHQQQDVQVKEHNFDQDADLENTKVVSADDIGLPNVDVGPIVGGGSSDTGWGGRDATSARPAAKTSTEVTSIDSHGNVSGDATPAAAADGPQGPDDGEDEPVLADNDPTLWLELPQAPSLLMLGWPLPATGVTSAFGERADPIDGDTRFHYGLDLEAQYGQVVKSAAAGRVAAVGMSGGHGRHVVITHAGGYQTGYSHLSQTMVYEGQMVEAGEAVGLVGTSGRTTGPHLHFEVTRWGSHIDPISVLGIALKLR